MKATNLIDVNSDRAMVDAIRMKKRHRDVTDIRQFYEYTKERALEKGNEAVFDLPYETMLVYFQKLAKDGKGKILDVPGEPLRFQWLYRHDSVAASILDPKGAKLIPFTSKPGSIHPRGKVKPVRSIPVAKKAGPTQYKSTTKSQFVKNDLKAAVSQVKNAAVSAGKVVYIALRPTLILSLNLPNDFKDQDRELINLTLKAALA